MNERQIVSPSRQLKPCGTNAAYQRHITRGEAPCDPCRQARRRYNTAWMRRARAQYPMGTCAACDRWRPIQRYGWCESCVHRWYRAGRPDTGPPPLMDPEEANRIRRERCIPAAKAAKALYDALRKGGWEHVL